MALIRPRLNDYHGLLFTQEEVDFAIPFIDEDIPLYLDPFLLWKSPSQQDTALHQNIVSSFNFLGTLYQKDEAGAVEILKQISECDEAGLGNSRTKKGKKIGTALAKEILNTFKEIPQIKEHGYTHFEEAQLLVENFSKDRISDIACNLIKSFLVDFTIQQCEKHKIPTESVDVSYFDTQKNKFVTETAPLPINPETKQPILLIPKRWLRFTPWLNIDNYFEHYISTSQKILTGQKIDRIKVLDYNRKNYDAVRAYTETRQSDSGACKNDPMFSQLPVISTKRKLGLIQKLPTGKTDMADRLYEDNISALLASMLYPELDFAAIQSRTSSGILIRDLIFYNNVTHPFLRDLHETFGSKQLVFEMKNVKEIQRDHINQLNRYMTNELGNFGVLFTRNQPSKRMFQNTIDLWSGQRKCILILSDEDLKLMCELYESKQRRPIDVLKMKYVEFTRACPA